MRRSSRLVSPSLQLSFALCLLLIAAAVPSRSSLAQTWGGYAGNAQHTALSSIPSLPLQQIVWQTPVDLNPQYTGDILYIHYGTPLASPANTIVIPVKTGVADTFRVEARRGSDGLLLWQLDSDYRLPPGFNWTPSYGPTLTSAGRVFVPAAGGTVLFVDNVDTPGAHTGTRVAFYGIANYNGNPAAFNADIQICSPLTSDSHGNVFFGFRATGANPLGIFSGVARIDSSGSVSYVTAAAAISELTGVTTMNCAPALSNDEGTVYVAMRRTGPITTSPRYLVGLDAATLATKYKVGLVDPYTSPTTNSSLPDDGTASPMVAPDGKVFFGVLERPAATNGQRGWLLQFDSTLVQASPPGAFGWDFTPSIVPASAVPSYTGSSPYLLMAKYNNYAGIGTPPISVGDGVNQLAILDPNSSQVDARSGRTIMKQVLTIAGVSPDTDFFPTYPNAVREWCINTAVVDPIKRCVLAGSEDGVLYRWNLVTNTFTESIVLTPGIGEAYTPTLIGPDGQVYAINNATLFAVGDPTLAGVPIEVGAGSVPELAAPRPTPFTGTTSIRFSLPRAMRVELAIVDLAGRRVATLVDRALPAGEQSASWDGRDADGRRVATGIYFVRLAAGSRTVARKVVLTR